MECSLHNLEINDESSNPFHSCCDFCSVVFGVDVDRKRDSDFGDRRTCGQITFSLTDDTRPRIEAFGLCPYPSF